MTDFYENTALLLPMNGANNSTLFIDRSHSPKQATVYGAAKISTTAYKYYGSSGRFDGDSAGISFTIPAIGIQDFTIETHAYLINGGHGDRWSRIFHLGSGNTYGDVVLTCFDLLNPPKVRASFWAPTEVVIGGESSATLQNNVWTHFAITRTSGTWRFFIDGQQLGSAVYNNTINIQDTLFNIGWNGSGLYGGENLYGHLQDLRVLIGVSAYTENFTPPAALCQPMPYPSGNFEWIGYVPNGSCNGIVTWDTNFTPAEGYLNLPPVVEPFSNGYVRVFGGAPDGAVSRYSVSPGVLTLTPTVTDANGRSVVLEPLYLNINLA